MNDCTLVKFFLDTVLLPDEQTGQILDNGNGVRKYEKLTEHYDLLSQGCSLVSGLFVQRS